MIFSRRFLPHGIPKSAIFCSSISRGLQITGGGWGSGCFRRNEFPDVGHQGGEIACFGCGFSERPAEIEYVYKIIILDLKPKMTTLVFERLRTLAPDPQISGSKPNVREKTELLYVSHIIRHAPAR